MKKISTFILLILLIQTTYSQNFGDLNKFADTDDLISVCVGVNGGLRGFTHRKLNLKKILTLMKVKENCKNQKIKNLGIYKYETSAIKNSNWGKKEKNKNNIKKKNNIRIYNNQNHIQ